MKQAFGFSGSPLKSPAELLMVVTAIAGATEAAVTEVPEVEGTAETEVGGRVGWTSMGLQPGPTTRSWSRTSPAGSAGR